jgi:hypothetical protein
LVNFNFYFLSHAQFLLKFALNTLYRIYFGDECMGLDRFMGTSEKKPDKKTSKKNTEKKTTKTTSQPKKDELSSQKAEIITSTHEILKPEIQKQISSFTFVTMHFQCTNPKCKKKKTIKKPQSFTPSNNDLICPTCGSPLKKSRGK